MNLHWMTLPVVLAAAFTMLGVPFGYQLNQSTYSIRFFTVEVYSNSLGSLGALSSIYLLLMVFILNIMFNLAMYFPVSWLKMKRFEH